MAMTEAISIKYFRLVGGEFVNPDDGASLVFDTKDKNAITMMLFGRVKFKNPTLQQIY